MPAAPAVAAVVVTARAVAAVAAVAVAMAPSTVAVARGGGGGGGGERGWWQRGRWQRGRLGAKAAADLHEPPRGADHAGEPADGEARTDGLLEDDVVERGAKQRAEREDDARVHGGGGGGEDDGSAATEVREGVITVPKGFELQNIPRSTPYKSRSARTAAQRATKHHK